LMLAAHYAPQSLLDRSATGPRAQSSSTGDGGSPAADKSDSNSLGAFLGPYKLLEQIGEGGMGTVWMAQQIEPVKRIVAIKLIKAGMDSKQVIAPFQAE